MIVNLSFMIFRDYFFAHTYILLIFRYLYSILSLKEEITMEMTELKIKEMIINRYGSLKKFCEVIDMPWTTLDSILKRGIANSNITNVLKITRELGIDAEKLVDGHISYVDNKPITLAAHFDGDEYTESEMDEILQFAEFVKNKRK